MGEIDILPKSRIVKVEFEVALPVAATYEEIDDWLRIETGRGGISSDNPLFNCGLEAINPPILTDTGFHLHEKAEPAGEGRYIIHRWREGSPFEGPSATDVALAALDIGENQG